MSGSMAYALWITANHFVVADMTVGWTKNHAVMFSGGATGGVATNVVNAQASWFIDVAGGGFHLSTAVSTVADKGQTLAAVTRDIDCETRPMGSGYDIGADERYSNSEDSSIIKAGGPSTTKPTLSRSGA